MSKHTPGPWSIRGKRLDIGTDAYCVASDWGGSNWKNDAPLIAAAPELLEALQELEPLFDNDSPLFPVYAAEIEKARAAIGKATGTTES